MDKTMYIPKKKFSYVIFFVRALSISRYERRLSSQNEQKTIL